MSLTLVTAPTAEPVTQAEAKAHCNVFHDDDNDIFASLIEAARMHCEAYTHRAFLSQVWDDKRDGFPCGGQAIWFDKAPLLTSTAPVVTYTDSAGDSQTWSSSLYTVDAPAGPHARQGRIFLNYGQTYPSTRSIENAVSIRFYCGYGTSASDVPEGIKAAMKLLIGHWYANREPVALGTIATPIPKAVDTLLWPFVSA